MFLFKNGWMSSDKYSCIYRIIIKKWKKDRNLKMKNPINPDKILSLFFFLYKTKIIINFKVLLNTSIYFFVQIFYTYYFKFLHSTTYKKVSEIRTNINKNKKKTNVTQICRLPHIYSISIIIIISTFLK